MQDYLIRLTTFILIFNFSMLESTQKNTQNTRTNLHENNFSVKMFVSVCMCVHTCKYAVCLLAYIL